MSQDEPVTEGRLTTILDRGVDLLVVLFAAWTVVYQVGLGVGATRVQVAAAATAAAIPAVWWVGTRGARIAIPAEERSAVVTSRPVVGATVLALVAGVLLVTGHDILFWFVAVAGLLSAWAAIGAVRPSEHRRPRTTGAGIVLLVAVIAGLLSAAQINWEQDNTYYVDRALAIRDAPGPLPVGRDTLYTADGRYPSLVPENDLASLEGLVGTVSSSLGGHPMSWLSFVVHPGFAFLGVVALWRAARGLGSGTPHLVALLGTIGVIGTRYFSSRTGRNGFVAVLVPLLVAYTVELVHHPATASAVRLVAAGVVSGGFTLSALPVVPVVVLVTALAVWPPGGGRRAARWIGGAGLLVLAYFIALTVAATLLGRSPVESDVVTTEAVSPGYLWRIALGEFYAYVPLTGLVLFAWMAAPTRSQRRFVVAAPLLALTIALSPPVLWLLRHTAAATAMTRLGWTIPLSLVAGVVVAGIWEARPARLGRVGAIGVLTVVLASAVVRAAPLRPAVPAWDVPPEAESAATLIELAPPGGIVAAPWDVAALVPVLGDDAFPMAVYPVSLERLEGDPGFASADRAELMSWLLQGTLGREPPRLAILLARLEVAAVCIDADARSGEMRRAMEAAGFRRTGHDRRCQFWALQPAT